MDPRLLIISPSYYRSKANRELFTARRRRVVPLTTAYLAALTPAPWQVQLIDEQLGPVDHDGPVDLVAISVLTLNSLRAYDIADEFRRRGVPVILGGPHTFFHAEEAGQHCDAVAIGEAEQIWPQMLQDARTGCLKRQYKADFLPSLAGLPMPRYNLLDLHRYGPFRTHVVVSSRGCPFRCEFCSERYLLGEEYRCRPVPEVIAEIRECGGRYLLFGDSNFVGNRSHTMELMEALIPLRVRWSALWPSYVCADPEFLNLAQRSGLLHVNIGFESLDPQTLQGMNKRFNKVDRYGELLQNLRSRGISYSLNFIMGWDGEREDITRASLDFLHEHKVPVAYFNILTPVKGTPFYDRLQNEGRLLNPEDIDRWPGQTCYIKPLAGSPEALEEKVREMYRGFYSLPSMLSRLPLPLTRASLASWVINFSQRRMAKADGQQNNFDDY